MYRMLYMHRHMFTCYTLHDRRLGRINRVVPIAHCSRCSDWSVIAERLSKVFVRTIFQRRRFGLDISLHQIHLRHDRRLGRIGRVVLFACNDESLLKINCKTILYIDGGKVTSLRYYHSVLRPVCTQCRKTD